ncbi:copper chaperone PCu(A)C [Candidatus Venteria ishoeyi]|uniref:Copper chaperone PCu(A)C n=1 Tax=Candidatus Venteria ishoeyi TaxID=1899563 RepID=A0A1H6F5G7_9GAMM|nr:copper chaperone PCu(A)C [Candidatus Venteria ishoeyi]MDM8545418.1 copper chaperone PCu(A)C [Candidatus Venteria ishoeyi]SEH04631.1 Uncharacterised protein [Candidatus Venteria ishoeyi]
MKNTQPLLMILFTWFLSCQVSAADLNVENAWVRSAPPNAPALAAFMTLQNTSNNDLKLLSADVKGYAQVELHRTIAADGMMKMVKQNFIPIPAKTELQLKPGSWHIMLIQPQKVPAVAESVSLKLSFDNGTQLDVIAVVKSGKMQHKGNMKHAHDQ